MELSYRVSALNGGPGTPAAEILGAFLLLTLLALCFYTQVFPVKFFFLLILDKDCFFPFNQKNLNQYTVVTVILCERSPRSRQMVEYRNYS